MSKKTDIKTCRFVGCPHGKKIDITKDDYVMSGKGMYYHPDCLKKKQSGSWKSEQTKADLQYIKNQWALHIDKTVAFSQLLRVLNEFVARGVSSDYLVFAFDYVIKHKMKLNYPNGFKYYVEKPEIKAAYRKSKFEKVDQSKFTVEASNFDAPQKTEPSPLISKRPQGFGSILRHKKKD